jgi:NhaA family Na+:H+ antiporter
VDRNAALVILLAGVLGFALANLVPGLSAQVGDVHHYAELGLALFFFVIGLELKHELTEGVFKQKRSLLVPVLAAIFGALIPAGIYYLVTFNDPVASHGWAIPMATDITFAVAVFSIFGSKLPKGSKQFLLAFAIIDDLLAILVIAIFLHSDVTIALLVTGSAVIGILVPTKWVAGIQDRVQPWVYLIILPVYAFSSLCFELNVSFLAVVSSLVAVAVMLRVIGKTIGITLGAYLGSLIAPSAIKLKVIFRISVLGGIGFTVAFFVNDIVFGANEELRIEAIVGSLVAAVISTGLAALALKTKSK